MLKPVEFYNNLERLLFSGKMNFVMSCKFYLNLFVLRNVTPVRNMATLKDSKIFSSECKIRSRCVFPVSRRLKSVKSIQKITKSMKMLSAANYAKAERELRGARAHGLRA